MEMAGTRSGPTWLSPGTQVDHFRILRPLGRGGVGEVYLARDTQLGRRVALKLVRPDALGNPDTVDRFRQEARITARFNHPHIVTIHAVGDFQGSPYVALEYLEGQTLRERLGEERSSVAEAMRIALAIAESLTEAHARRILHRDLKPENVLLPRDGRLRVVDFGMSKALAAPEPEGDDEYLPSRPSVTDFIVGTPLYMAPEQWLRKSCTEATDMWALGVMLFELLSGHRPYEQTELSELCAAVTAERPVPRLELAQDVPAELFELVARCLEKRPLDRPLAQEVAEALRRLLVGAAPSFDQKQVNPFRGLLPFTERHAATFFGRENEVAVVLERLRNESVLPVVGPSGAGKSSLVQAGVVLRLRELGRWLFFSMRPGREPFAALAARVVRGETPDAIGSLLSQADTDAHDPIANKHELQEIHQQLE